MDWSELSDWNEYSRITIALLAMVPIPVIVPLFLGVLGDRPVEDKKRIALHGCIGFLVALTTFTFLGDALLDLFGITIQAVRWPVACCS